MRAEGDDGIGRAEERGVQNKEGRLADSTDGEV